MTSRTISSLMCDLMKNNARMYQYFRGLLYSSFPFLQADCKLAVVFYDYATHTHTHIHTHTHTCDLYAHTYYEERSRINMSCYVRLWELGPQRFGSLQKRLGMLTWALSHLHRSGWNLCQMRGLEQWITPCSKIWAPRFRVMALWKLFCSNVWLLITN